MKIEELIANATAVGSPVLAERDILEVTLGVFWLVQADIVVEEPFCDLGISLEPYVITLLRVI